MNQNERKEQPPSSIRRRMLRALVFLVVFAVGSIPVWFILGILFFRDYPYLLWIYFCLAIITIPFQLPRRWRNKALAGFVLAYFLVLAVTYIVATRVLFLTGASRLEKRMCRIFVPSDLVTLSRCMQGSSLILYARHTDTKHFSDSSESHYFAPDGTAICTEIAFAGNSCNADLLTWNATFRLSDCSWVTVCSNEKKETPDAQ